MTRRLWELADLVGEGFSNKEVASRMGLTLGTVKVYLAKVYKALHISEGPWSNRARLVKVMLGRGR